MRDQLIDGIIDGDVDVPDDRQTLVELQRAQENAKLDRKRASFKSRFHEYVRERYERGGWTPTDIREGSSGYRRAADVLGCGLPDYVDRVLNWYGENYARGERPPFPDADAFLDGEPDSGGFTGERVTDGDKSVPEGVSGGTMAAVRRAFRGGASRDEARSALDDYHDGQQLDAALAYVYDGESGQEETEA
jgi:hypothetical protein